MQNAQENKEREGEFMALYRCAACGSSRVVPETKQEGYNKKQGIRGMALFGLGGAVAGTSGNTVVYYHCAACGHTINKCMSEIDKKFLEQYLLKPADAASIMRLREYKKQYPNIEWEEPTTNSDLPINTNPVNINKEKWNEADIYDIEKAVLNALYDSEIPCTVAEMQVIDKSCQEYSVLKLSIAAKFLEKSKIIERSDDNNEVCYKPIISSKKEALLLLHKMELEKARQASKALKSRLYEQSCKEHSIAVAILNALYEVKEPCTIPWMQFMNESYRRYSNQMISVTTRKLVTGGILEKNIKDGKAYFKAIPASKDEAILLLSKIFRIE